MTGGALTGLTGALTTSGTITGGTLTDGTATLTSGILTGLNDATGTTKVLAVGASGSETFHVTAAGAVTGSSITDGMPLTLCLDGDVLEAAWGQRHLP